MVCMEHFQHLQKKDFSKIGVSYASCGPSSRQGGIWVSERGDVIPLSEVNLVHSCHASSFIKPKQYKMDLQTKRNYTRWFTVYTTEERELSSRGLSVSPQTMNMNIFNIYKNVAT